MSTSPFDQRDRAGRCCWGDHTALLRQDASTTVRIPPNSPTHLADRPPPGGINVTSRLGAALVFLLLTQHEITELHELLPAVSVELLELGGQRPLLILGLFDGLTDQLLVNV